jgi:hypothetical protein
VIQFTDTCSIHRMMQKAGAATGQKVIQARYAKAPCLIIPISQFQGAMPFALESTHVVFLPRWVTDLRPEDEVRRGRRVTKNNAAVPYVFVVNGIRRYENFGLRHVEAFCKERE